MALINAEDNSRSSRPKIILLEERGRDRYGRVIRRGKCPICQIILDNARSYSKHYKDCHVRPSLQSNTSIRDFFTADVSAGLPPANPIPIPDTLPVEGARTMQRHTILTPENRALVEALCKLGLPLSIIKKREWTQLLRVLGCTVAMPSIVSLKLMIHAHAADINSRICSAVRDQVVTLITDGGSIREQSHYVAIWYCNRKVYFGGIFPVARSTSQSIADALSAPIKKLQDAGATVAAVVTDNARNLINATETLSTIAGHSILRIACSIHTSNLILTDLANENEAFRMFREQYAEFFKYLRTKEVRSVLKPVVSGKIPLIQEIKWLSYYEAGLWMDRNLEVLNQWLVGRGKDPIPQDWLTFQRILRPLGEVMLRAQANHILLYEFYTEYENLVARWRSDDDPIAHRLADLLEARFSTTGDIPLAYLCHMFSRTDVRRYQELWRKYYSWNPRDVADVQSRQSLSRLRSMLIAKLTSVCKYYGVEMADMVVPILFDPIMQVYVLSESVEPPVALLRGLSTRTDLLPNGGRVFWTGVVTVIHTLIQIPASESIAERVFSHLHALVPPTRYSSSDRLIDSQMTVRMQNIFDEYNKKVKEII